MNLEAIRICAALAWADGTIARDEAEALTRMIRRARLGEADSRAAFGFLSSHVELPDGTTIAPEKCERVYRAAAALASSDGQLHPDERRFLDRLRVRLGLDEATASRLEIG